MINNSSNSIYSIILRISYEELDKSLRYFPFLNIGVAPQVATKFGDILSPLRGVVCTLQ